MASTQRVDRGTPASYRHLAPVLVLLIPVTALAFAKSYLYGHTFSGLALSPLVHLHAALMVVWLLMLPAQAWFVRTRRLALHRRVGRSSYVIVPLVVLTTALLAHETLNRKPEITTLDARIEIYDLMQVIGFGGAWWLGMAYKRRTAIHVRYMVSTLFAAGNAILFRILLSWFGWVPGLSMVEDPANVEHVAAVNGGLLILALLALIVRDWSQGMRRSPYWFVLLTTLFLHVGFFTFTKSETWMSLVRGFASW